MNTQNTIENMFKVISPEAIGVWKDINHYKFTCSTETKWDIRDMSDEFDKLIHTFTVEFKAAVYRMFILHKDVIEPLAYDFEANLSEYSELLNSGQTLNRK